MLSKSPSVITRLVLGYGALLIASSLALATVFYLGTVGVLNRGIDRKISLISGRLLAEFQSGSGVKLVNSISRELTDGTDSDSEIFFVGTAAGAPLAGNLASIPLASLPFEQLVTRDLVRNGHMHRVRLLARRLPSGGVLLVGRDLSEQDSIQSLVGEALAAGGATSIVLGLVGALWFRRALERRIAEIRMAAKDIEAGDLSRRIPPSGNDEFGLLNRDINRMLDRIEQLMNGVRHISNAIAHDLRTPLSRIRGKLDDALRPDATAATLAESAHLAIADIDELTQLFEKLLYIAEAESGMREQQFEAVELGEIALDMVELYDATAEERGSLLEYRLGAAVRIMGDRNLLGNAVASLIDNAIKHTPPGTSIVVSTLLESDFAAIEVRDNGPGIPQHELARVTERFYRLDRSRSLPGNGLGLSIVSAIATLHGGALSLQGQRGLLASISLPRSHESVTPGAVKGHG
jgi:signal transduction histidine kinase